MIFGSGPKKRLSQLRLGETFVIISHPVSMKEFRFQQKHSSPLKKNHRTELMCRDGGGTISRDLSHLK